MNRTEQDRTRRTVPSKPFQITHVFPDGTEVVGLFVAKKLSVAEQLHVKVLAAQRCGGLHPAIDPQTGTVTGAGIDFTTYLLAVKIATIELALSPPVGKAPEWFDLDTITEDLNDSDGVIAKVYAEVKKHEEECFRRPGQRRPGDGDEAPPERGQPSDPDAGGDGDREEARPGTVVRHGSAQGVGGPVRLARE